MIETEEFTFAENKEEAYWIRVRDARIKRIESLKKELEEIPFEIKVEEAFLEVAQKMIKNEKKKPELLETSSS